MTFDEVLAHVQELLQREKRIAYRSLKRRLALDDESLEDLKAELIDAKRVAVDEDGKVLVWAGRSAKEETAHRRIGEAASEDTASASTLRTANSEPRAAERRQLTVMFCDVVGSTALSTQLDPEDLRTVIQAYRDTCATAISRFGGYLAKYIGDGLLVYFGYPQAHDDDAARAVRTGLEIVAAMQHLSFPTIQLPRPLQVHLGIHTGLVVAGEMGTEAQPEPLAIVGETPNIAARLQEKADPNNVVISPTTYRLVSGLFESEELAPQTLKGLSTSFVMYRVIGESVAQSRFEAAMQTGLTPLVGRAEELALLRQRWEQATAGEGQVVLLSGEPGMGKSRLVQELKAQLGQEGVTRVEYRGSPYHQNSALYPIIEHLQRLLQLAREDTPTVKLEKLQRMLSHYRFPQADTVPLLAALLSLPHPEGYPPITVSSQKQKEKTHAALVAWLIEETEQNTVYTIWEDLHWADPSTVEVLTLLLDQVPTTRLLAVLTFRPEFTPSWGNRSHLSQMTLSRLGRPEVETMVERVAGGQAFSAEVMQQIVVKTDGVPLFVEELTKSVVESVGAMPASSLQLAIPATLHDSLMARLDRLGAAKEIAQVGATIGREFDYALLQAVSSLNEEALQQGLKQLVTAELVYQRGLVPQATYLFKHALIQDTAYQSLLKSKRQQYHQQIAQVLKERFPEIVETQAELLAHHYTEAGLIAQAIPYWHQAGQRAVQRSAHVEAISHLTKGLELLKTLPDTSKRAPQELMLQLTLGVPLQATRGWAVPEVKRAYARARELCQQIGETPQLFPVLWGLAAVSIIQAEHKTGRELAEQCLTLAQSIQDTDFLLEAHTGLGLSLFHLGELVSAREHIEQVIALYDHKKHRYLAFRYGAFDPGVACLSFVAWSLWHLGYPDQALQRTQEALTLAQEIAHPFSRGFALFFVAATHQFRQESQATHERAEAAITFSTDQVFPEWVALGTLVRGWALTEQGQEEEGIAQMRQGLAAHQAIGAEVSRSYYLGLLAEACGRVGQIEEGLQVLVEALAFVSHSGERYREAELYRLKGELLLQSARQGAVWEAEECFRQAIAIARQQQAKSLELRAVTSLSRLWQQQGKKEEARQLLAEIYHWFTEGFDTKDLQEAKALLAALSSP
jgi:TOMM system kinase/cyclase fusion protein